MRRVAILDLGTNTFNLLIAEEAVGDSYKIVYNHKIPVKLGEGKINDGEIIPAAFERGINAVTDHYQTILKFNVDQVKAFGTSALRSAQNGDLFLGEIKARTKLDVELISGNREAELIYLGVRQTIDLQNSRFLILDIGGGSNELIIADMKKIFWKKSYPLGIARLLEQFQPSDPITNKEIEEINNHLLEELPDLFNFLRINGINTLVGASGSFETFLAMIQESDQYSSEGSVAGSSSEISLHDYDILFQKLIKSTTEERKKMKGLEPMRIEMIVLASLFVKFILENHNFDLLIQSNYALKEGAIYEILNS